MEAKSSDRFLCEHCEDKKRKTRKLEVKTKQKGFFISKHIKWL